MRTTPVPTYPRRTASPSSSNTGTAWPAVSKPGPEEAPARRGLAGQPVAQRPGELGGGGAHVGGERLADDLPLARPALELASGVLVGTAEPLKADRHVVDTVQRGQRRGQGGHHPRHRGVVELVESRRGLHGHPRHEPGDGERAADQRLVLAQDDGRRDRHVGRPQGRGHPELAGDVVGRRRPAGARRGAQHPGRDPVVEAEGEVGAATGDQAGAQRAGRLDARPGHLRRDGRQLGRAQPGAHAPCSAVIARTARLAIDQRWTSEGPS